MTVKTWRSDAIAKKCTLSWNERDRALGPHGCPLDYGTPCREDAGAEIEQLQRLASVGRHAQLAGIFAWKDFGGRFFGSDDEDGGFKCAVLDHCGGEELLPVAEHWAKLADDPARGAVGAALAQTVTLHLLTVRGGGAVRALPLCSNTCIGGI